MITGVGRSLALALLVGPLGCALAEPGPAWESPLPPASDSPVVRPGSLARETLDNGLRVLVLEDRRLPRVALGVAVRRGAGSEDPARAGLAAFTAELMGRGAGERDALALAQAVDAIGASLAVRADWDSMAVGVTGLSRDFERLFEILADVALRPRFDRGEAAKAGAEQREALKRARDDPETLVRWHAQGALYPDHRFGLPLSGTPETVSSLDAKAARDFYRRVFVASNAIVYASGDVAPAEFIARVRRAFADWPAGEAPPSSSPPPHPAPPERRVVVVDDPDLVQAQVIVAHEGIRRADPRRIAVALMNSVLGGSGFSSRLMASVRAEAGLTYGVYSYFAMRRVPGPFAVATFTRVTEARRLVDLLLSELERIRSAPPDADELRHAKNLAVGRFALSLETSDAVLSQLVDLDIYALPENSLDTYRARVRAVSVEESARVARELIHPVRAALVLVGPAESLVPELQGLGPLEVVKP